MSDVYGAARKIAIVISSSRGRKSTVTGMPTRSSSNGVPSILVITRGPSSSSTTAATYGTRSLNGGRSFWCTTEYVYSVARPVASFHETSSLQHLGQNGRG